MATFTTKAFCRSGFCSECLSLTLSHSLCVYICCPVANDAHTLHTPLSRLLFLISYLDTFSLLLPCFIRLSMLACLFSFLSLHLRCSAPLSLSLLHLSACSLFFHFPKAPSLLSSPSLSPLLPSVPSLVSLSLSIHLPLFVFVSLFFTPSRCRCPARSVESAAKQRLFEKNARRFSNELCRTWLHILFQQKQLWFGSVGSSGQTWNLFLR